MDIQQTLFSDPTYQMMQGRSGLAPDQYWSSLHPEAKKQHLSRIGADPATYLSEQQYANSQAVGANSGPNAFLSNNPVLAGYDGNPVQPVVPTDGAGPILSPNRDSMLVQDAPGALSDPARSDASIVTPRPGQNPETLRNALLKRPGNRTQDIPGYGPVETPVATAVPQRDVPPANDLTAAALLKKQEGVLATENVGQRQKLETMIRDLEQGLTSAADLPRLEQLKAKLSELGGPTSENVSTPEYEAAAQDYMRQLEDAQVMAVEARPTVNAARTEIQNLLPLLKDPSAPQNVKDNAQSRIEDAQAVIAQSEADADAIRGVPAGAPGYTQPYSLNMPEQQVQPVLSANSNPEKNMDNYRPAPGGRQAAALEDPNGTVVETDGGALVATSNVNDAPSVTTNSTTSRTGNGTTNSTTQSTSRTMSPSTGNARGSQMGYGKAGRAEMLMRVGGVMQANAVNGYGAAMGAASDEYGQIQDDRRAADTAAYEQSEDTRLKEATMRAAAARARASGNKGAQKGPPSAVYKQATLSAITRIKDLLGSESGFNPFDNVSGWTGSLLSSVPGTAAHDALNSINTIEAAVGFDRLQKMRDDSPTGGALGQVTERELALLSQSLGSLKQSSSRPQFVANLNAVEKHYQAAVAAVEAQQAEWYRMNGGTTPTNSTVAPNGAGTTAAPSSDAVQAALDKYK